MEPKGSIGLNFSTPLFAVTTMPSAPEQRLLDQQNARTSLYEFFSSFGLRTEIVERALIRIAVPPKKTSFEARREAPAGRPEKALGEPLTAGSMRGHAVATDTGRGTRKGAVKKRSQRQTKMMGQKRSTKRSKASGEFISQKKPRTRKCKGVRRERS
jgi:hypothetical protein